MSALVLVACSGPTPASTVPEAPVRSDPARPVDDARAAERHVWATSTRSPQPFDARAGDGSPCGSSDRALERVAERIALREAAGKRPLDTSELTFALRSEGAPYVWPRAWTLEGPFGVEVERAKLTEWLATLGDHGERRCGSATLRTTEGRRALGAIAVSVLADLEPLPTRVTIGTWLDVRATLLVPATSAEVVVLGPRGRPHAVLASLAGTRVRARFRADREGAWLVQVLATTADGPRVVTEALVAAGTEPPETYDFGHAPGEELAEGARTPEEVVLAMVNAARRAEGLAPVRRDGALDRLAAAQAQAVLGHRTLSHVASGEGLDERVSALDLHSAGENVAHATNLARAHRSLWRSPSHRENLLHPAFELVGVGVARDDDGSVWLCQIFAARNAPH
ncbi:MAG TPA: CAP domain-containing protein [Polyangiaceae bacterium]